MTKIKMLAVLTAAPALLWLFGLSHVGAQTPPPEAPYFTGVELRALFGAERALLSEDPAAVLVFAPTPGGLQAASRFDAWHKQPRRYPYATYAILVVPAERPIEVVEEMIRHRGMSLPLFATQDDMLQGRDVRVLLLSGGAFRELAEFDQAVVEARMDDLAARSGLAPSDAAQAQAAETTASQEGDEDDPQARKYVNRRYGFTILFPPGWRYSAAKNGDGAVGKAPADSSLDFRVWGTPNYEETPQGVRRLNLKSYLAQHLDFIGESSNANVTVDRRLVVHDDSNVEGRDYTYSYAVQEQPGAGAQKKRGRIQVFELNGVIKVANVEGPAADFDRGEQMIEDFFYSFRPVPETPHGWSVPVPARPPGMM